MNDHAHGPDHLTHSGLYYQHWVSHHLETSWCLILIYHGFWPAEVQNLVITQPLNEPFKSKNNYARHSDASPTYLYVQVAVTFLTHSCYEPLKLNEQEYSGLSWHTTSTSVVTVDPCGRFTFRAKTHQIPCKCSPLPCTTIQTLALSVTVLSHTICLCLHMLHKTFYSFCVERGCWCFILLILGHMTQKRLFSKVSRSSFASQQMTQNQAKIATQESYYFWLREHIYCKRCESPKLVYFTHLSRCLLWFLTGKSEAYLKLSLLETWCHRLPRYNLPLGFASLMLLSLFCPNTVISAEALRRVTKHWEVKAPSSVCIYSVERHIRA